MPVPDSYFDSGACYCVSVGGSELDRSIRELDHEVVRGQGETRRKGRGGSELDSSRVEQVGEGSCTSTRQDVCTGIRSERRQGSQTVRDRLRGDCGGGGDSDVPYEVH